jgi:putative transcriptional regulator
MRKISTTGIRRLVGDVWHDDNGPIAGTPADWDPPMTVDVVEAAALSDPDAQPLTRDVLNRLRLVPLAKFVRRKLGLSQPDFAERYHIPLGTLRDWEQGRVEPDAAAVALLKVIEKEPERTARALESA